MQVRVRRPDIPCPIPGCGYVASGTLDLHTHQQRDHSQAEVNGHRRETEAAEVDANNTFQREQDNQDRYLEFGG